MNKHKIIIEYLRSSFSPLSCCSCGSWWPWVPSQSGWSLGTYRTWLLAPECLGCRPGLACLCLHWDRADQAYRPPRPCHLGRTGRCRPGGPVVLNRRAALVFPAGRVGPPDQAVPECLVVLSCPICLAPPFLRFVLSAQCPPVGLPYPAGRAAPSVQAARARLVGPFLRWPLSLPWGQTGPGRRAHRPVQAVQMVPVPSPLLPWRREDRAVRVVHRVPGCRPCLAARAAHRLPWVLSDR